MKKIPNGRANNERIIEDAILKHPDALGFPSASCIRNVRLTADSGRIDVLILPNDSQTKLAIVEVKQATSQEAADRVVGQLLKYYVCALRVGSVGLVQIKEFATKHGGEDGKAQADRVSTPKQMFGIPQADAQVFIGKGVPLQPDDIALFIALNDDPTPMLKSIVSILADHGIDIHIVKVTGDDVTLIE